MRASDTAALDSRFGQPVVKDGCGVFGILRKADAPRISNTVAVGGISCVQYRGSGLGAGYAAFSSRGGDNAPRRVQAFVRDGAVAEFIGRRLEGEAVEVREPTFSRRADPDGGKLGVWEALLYTRSDGDRALETTIDAINQTLMKDDLSGRIFSYGRYVSVYKDVGYPLDVARLWGLDAPKEEADMWLAHTRQPTNSPGTLPLWSHPFASMDTAIVHNGDISSFGSNVELLNSWGIGSHVGTDSEVIARLLDHLIRVEGLSVREAATVLTNPFERRLSRGLGEMLVRFRGARLDGPFAVVAGYADEEDTYLVALTDRSKFRPLLIGEDENCFYVASEENQIRAESNDARIWAPEPGSFFIASLKKGMLASGTTRDLATQTSAPESRPTKHEVSAGWVAVDAAGKEFGEINEAIAKASSQGKGRVSVTGCSGQRYLGIGLSTGNGARGEHLTIKVTGLPGNCIANLNDGASFEIFGNAADDIADTMHAGSVVVHGSARDVVGQALQGGRVFVRGTVGNRAAIQMREYKHRRPFLIVGGTADDYLGEYMAGGVVMVLNLSNASRPAGSYVGTGMVGGRIYVRGRLDDSQVGLSPQRDDILNYLRAYTLDGTVSKESYAAASAAGYPGLELLAKHLPKEVLARVNFLFFSSKYSKPPVVERRKLDEGDLLLVGESLRAFFVAFDLPHQVLDEVLASEFTILKTADEKLEMHVPPQEAPVEE